MRHWCIIVDVDCTTNERAHRLRARTRTNLVSVHQRDAFPHQDAAKRWNKAKHSRASVVEDERVQRQVVRLDSALQVANTTQSTHRMRDYDYLRTA